MDIRSRAFCQPFDIFIFKLPPHAVGLRNQEVTKIERYHRQQYRSHDIRTQEPLETYSATQYRDDFGMSCHLRGEEYHRYKDKEIDKKIDEIRDERYIIMKHHFFKRCLVFYEAIDIFRHIEDYHDEYQQTYREEESAYVFFKYIPI